MAVPAQEDEENLPFLHNFVLFGLVMDWMMPTNIVEGRCFLLGLLIQLITYSKTTITDTCRYNVLPATGASLSPVKLIHKINHDLPNS